MLYNWWGQHQQDQSGILGTVEMKVSLVLSNIYMSPIFPIHGCQHIGITCRIIFPPCREYDMNTLIPSRKYEEYTITYIESVWYG